MLVSKILKPNTHARFTKKEFMSFLSKTSKIFLGTPGKPTHNKNWLLITNTKTRGGLTVSQIMNFFIAEFRLNLKKVGKTTRPFRYDLNQIPYNYTVEVRIDSRN